jgi:hypothetical protein
VVRCQEGCLSCNSKGYCDWCDETFIEFKGKCLNECPAGFYNFYSYCFNCDYKCLTCFDDSDNCIYCSKYFIFDPIV